MSSDIEERMWRNEQTCRQHWHGYSWISFYRVWRQEFLYGQPKGSDNRQRWLWRDWSGCGLVRLLQTCRDLGPCHLHRMNKHARSQYSVWGYRDRACSRMGIEKFLHCGLRQFRHSKSSVYRWYPQLDRRRFVYDTYRTMKTTLSRHGLVHIFITHCLSLL